MKKLHSSNMQTAATPPGANSHPTAIAMRLIEQGGPARVVGRQLLDAQQMLEEGHALRGWFVGRAQRKRARKLIDGGAAKKEQCLQKAEWMLSHQR